MGLIDRLKRITLGKLDAYLQSMETPEVVLPQLIEEMNGKLKQAINAEAKSLTALRSSQRKLDEANGRVSRMQEAAKLALKSGEEDLARQAVAAELQAQELAAPLEQQVAQAQSAYENASQVRKQLTDQLAWLKQKKTELINRDASAKLQQSLLANSIAGKDNLLDAVARMEDQVLTDEIKSEIQSEAARMLHGELDELNNISSNAAIEARINELKNQKE